jgi:hypothetical protein
MPNSQPEGPAYALLVWFFTFDLSGMGDLASCYANADVFLRILEHASPTTTLQYGGRMSLLRVFLGSVTRLP